MWRNDSERRNRFFWASCQPNRKARRARPTPAPNWSWPPELPVENSRCPGKAAPSMSGRSEELILQAQQAEFARNDLRRSMALYDQALAAAVSPSQRVAIRLQMGRALSKSGDTEGARFIYKNVLEQPVDLADEYGIPFSLYAAERLSVIGREWEAVIVRLEELMAENDRLPPTALYLCRDVLAQVGEKAQGSPDLQERVHDLGRLVEDRLRTVDRLFSLKGFVTGRISSSRSLPQADTLGTWEAFGDGRWVVGIRGGLADDTRYLFVFNGPEVLRAVLEEDGLAGTFQGACRMTAGSEAQAIPLQKPFQGLWLQFEKTDVSSWSKNALPLPIFYWSILVLAFGFTMFGMYLLWRDVRRELALADMRSQFAANVSHELKTPLTAIRMFAEALAMGVKERPEAQREYLRTIINESERLSRLLNNVLDFSKIEQGTRTYRLESVSLEQVIQAAVQSMAFPLDQKGFDLRVEVEEGISRVRGDKDALEQAVLNLLHNAVKYSGDSRKILLRLRSRDGTASIDVVDFGIGISEENKTRIFGKFFRAPGAENQRIPGTGLGLAIVSHIAQAHGGRVEVLSRPGEGSTFTIVLPLEEE
jgi:signal transduction histidine kinase